MRMTIDDAIKYMEQARYDYCEYWEETRNDTTIAFDMAIETMHKYQKIKQIVKSLEDGEINYPQMTYYLQKVLENGNDD